MNNDFLFNPGSLEPDQLLEEFVGRQDLLERLLGVVRTNRRDQPQQHILLIGPRGMGKTMTLLALTYRTERDPQLAREWMTLVLPEELYGVGDLADFWLIVAERLYAQTEQASTAVDSLRTESPEDIAEQALDLCLHEIDRRGRRLLLCIENLNDFFESISDDDEQHRLRAFLMEDYRVMLAGSATSYFGAVSEMDRPFFDFFRPFVLRRFERDEIFEVLEILARRRNDQSILEILAREPQRIQSLHILTGGNPRLVKVIYRLLREGSFVDARRDLQRLIDDCTPYFKHRIESLAREQRRVFDRLAQSWDPVSAGDLERVLRRPSSKISTYLRRLVDDGYVEEAPGSTDKRKRYQVAERFYNIYYLMRFSRAGRRRLEWLTCYMQVVYSPEDYRGWVDRMLNEIHAAPAGADRTERVEFLGALVSSAADEPLRHELARKAVSASFEADQLQTLDDLLDRQAAREALGEAELNIVDLLAGLDDAGKTQIGYRPNDSQWWYALTDLLENREMWSEAEAAYGNSIEIDPNDANPWNGLGNLYQDHLERYDEAENAFRKAIDIDPNYAYPWAGLADCLHTRDKLVEARTSAIRAVNIGASIAWPRRAFLKVCGQDPSAWAEVLPDIMQLDSSEATPEIFEFVLRGSRLLLESGQIAPAEMLAWIPEPISDGWLDEFALALRASAEPKILEQVAPERRAVAQDLLAQLAQDKPK